MESDTKQYLDEHGLNRLFKDMLTCLLEDRPTEPLEYLITGLQRVKAVPSNLRPASFLRYFHRHGDQNGDEADVFDMDSLRELSAAPLPADFVTARRQSVSAESYQPGGAELRRVVVPKSPLARGRIEAAVANNLLFRNLDADQRDLILDAMFERRVKKGDIVIRQGDEGDNFYFVQEGQFEVLVNGESQDVLGPGKTFGELALMYNCPRAATIQCVEDGVLWAVDRETFSRTIIDVAFKKRKLYEGFLRSVPLLSSLTDQEISRIADALESAEFADGHVVVKEGDVGEDFYLIVEGAAVVQKDGHQVARLGPGDYFGEKALMEHAPRSATVIAEGPLKCVVLAESAFQRLLGPLKELMMRHQQEAYVVNV